MNKDEKKCFIIDKLRKFAKKYVPEYARLENGLRIQNPSRPYLRENAKEMRDAQNKLKNNELVI